jgi:hypothetical protein
MKDLYSKTKTDLLSEYKDVILNAAIRRWKLNKIPYEDISDKIESLNIKLDVSSRNEVIALYGYYVLGTIIRRWNE